MSPLLYTECELEFGKIADILEGNPSPEEIRHAQILAWRMNSRLEEIRNRHVDLRCSKEA